MAKIGYFERIIIENANFAKDWKNRRTNKYPVHNVYPTPMPEQYNPRGVTPDIFKQWEGALAKACVDLVIATKTDDGTPAVVGLQRNAGTPYEGTWYMPGGTLAIYNDISHFALWKTGKECGLWVAPEALMGVYRNDASDHACTVIALCYAVLVDFEEIQKNTKAADGHMNWRLFTAEGLDILERENKEQTHWYPMHVWRRALKSMPD